MLRSPLTLHVPGEYPFVADAVRAARRGDTVQIAAGTIHMSRVGVRFGISVRGAGMGKTILIGSFEMGEGGSNVTISDLTLVRTNRHYAIELWEGVTIERVEISGFTAAIRTGGGWDDETTYVRESRIHGNVWGISAEEAHVEIVNNEILHNTKGGIVAQRGVNGTILHNTIVGNGFAGVLEGQAGGIALGPGGRSVVRNNIIVGNRFGVNCAGCDVTLGTNDVWGNTDDYVGNAVAGPDDLSIDPRFYRPGSDDYTLRAGSPCIDAGPDVGVNADMLGRARSAGSGPDLGAHEWALGLAGVVITEVMANPLDERTGEYVELLNTSDGPVEVADIVIDDGDSRDAVVPMGDGGTVLPAGGYAVILDPGFAGQYEIPDEAIRLTVGNAAIGNGLSIGDTVALFGADGVTVASTYGHPFDPGNGVSAERVAPAAPDAPGSWAASPCGASPGAPNCAAEQGGDPTGLQITEVMANPLDEATGEFVELTNLDEAPLELAGLVLSDGDADDTLEAFDGGPTSLPAGGWAVVVDRGYAGQYTIPEAAVVVTVGDGRLGSSLSVDDPVTLRDEAGTPLASFSYPFDPGNGRSVERVDLGLGDAPGAWVAAPCDGPVHASPGAPNCAGGDLVDPAGLTVAITEVMANALTEDTGEYVELFNHGDAPVDVSGFVLDDGDATDWLLPFADGDGVIPPGGWAVVMDPELAGDYEVAEGAVLLVPDDTSIA